MPRRPAPHRSKSVSSRSPCVRILGSVAQAFFNTPTLNEPSDLVAVLVHHHHVRVALDADVGQVDETAARRPLKASAYVTLFCRMFFQRGCSLALSPITTRIGVPFTEAILFLSPPSVGSTATSAFTLSGRASSTL